MVLLQVGREAGRAAPAATWAECVGVVGVHSILQGVVGGRQPVALLRRRSGPPAKESVIDERHYADRGRRRASEAASPFLIHDMISRGAAPRGVKSTPFPAR